MSDTPAFDLVALQMLNGAELGVLRAALPSDEALAVLETEQHLALRGEYGAGVIVFLRPTGDDPVARAERAEAGAAVLRDAATDLISDLMLLCHPDESTLWQLGGQPLERDYQALKAALADDAGTSLLAELRAARAVAAALQAGIAATGNCPICGQDERVTLRTGYYTHHDGCVLAAYEATTKAGI